MITVEAEFLGGPVDGVRMVIPDDTKLWLVQQPPMTAAEFIAMDEGLRPPLMDIIAQRTREYAYGITEDFNAQNGARKFRYIGERVAK